MIWELAGGTEKDLQQQTFYSTIDNERCLSFKKIKPWHSKTWGLTLQEEASLLLACLGMLLDAVNLSQLLLALCRASMMVLLYSEICFITFLITGW